MARDIAFDDVHQSLDQFGPIATLVTVNDDGRPHAVSVDVRVGDDRLIMEVGTRTRANLRVRPGVSLLWHPRTGGDYQLIIDGVADGDGDGDGPGTASVMVERGILHRLAGAAGTGPTCISLGDS
ncbi:MAG TPA: pyridoxamine 5'-phosphate oxidase family protein [Ilumatobacteraceae bacterium]|nr:pyridoxamine 5'-phosphate oxidase family protein [Ilumatobacteraceae bacterium]